MPHLKKQPQKKAVLRSSSAKKVAKKPKPQVAPKAVKRSAKPKVELKARSGRKPAKAAPKPEQAAVNAKPKRAIAKAKPKAKQAIAKPKARAARKAAPRVTRSLILPPRPKRLAARVLIAPAPRTPRALEVADDLELPSRLARTIVVPAPSMPAPASALRIRERSERPRLTPETWGKLEASAARLGRAALSDEQRVALRSALEGHDTLLVLPDAERAATCYQLAAQLLDQPTVVVSPVQAELKAQVDALAASGALKIPAIHVPTALSGPERSSALTRITRGGSLLVLLSPEALHAPDVRQALAKSGIALFVAEEAHCASNTSHELRPSYAELGTTLHSLGSPPVMAVTRVATLAVRRDITEHLGLSAPVTVLGDAVRSNLQLVTKLARGEGRQASLLRLIERLELPGLIWCATPHDVDSVFATLRGAGIAARRHHGGMPAAERESELASFALPSDRSVMVAVSAFAPSSGVPGIGDAHELGFGRGPGKRNLRFVVHYQSPASLEQYLREIEHAGRDGKNATCVLLHESSHRSLHEVMLAQSRFKAVHLAELNRALETPALEGRAVTLEALALGTGQSRRTTDRLTALLADAGAVSRTGGWVRVLCSASELDEACRRLGTQLYALREQDARRLASVSAFAESTECKLSCLSQYLGEGKRAGCGRCNACSPELLAPSQESLIPHAASRRAVVQEFSVQAVTPPLSGVVPSHAQAPGSPAPLSAKLGDFGSPNRH